MPTPLNQSLADSALLTKSLPLGLLRAFVQTDAADDGLTPQLLAELKILARTPGLLVACNYGGTLCAAEGISTETLPLASAAIALRALAALPNTHAAVISGRSLRDLAAVSRLPAEVHLVGSHGTEFDMGYAHSLSLATESVLQQAHQALAETVGAYRGISIERKPVAVSVHTRPRRRTSLPWPPEGIRSPRTTGCTSSWTARCWIFPWSNRPRPRPWSTCAPCSASVPHSTPATRPAMSWPWQRCAGRTWRCAWGRGPPWRPTGSGTRSRSPASWRSCSNCAGRGFSARTPWGWNGTP